MTSTKRITHENKAKEAKLREWEGLTDDGRVFRIRMATHHLSSFRWASFFTGMRHQLLGSKNPDRPTLPTPTSAARGFFRAGQEVAKGIDPDTKCPDWYAFLTSLVEGTPAPFWGDCHRSN